LKLKISNLDEAAARRAQQFVRLRRALGWTSTELDHAIHSFGGTLTEDTMRRLAHAERLRQGQGLSVDQVVALWTPIDVRPRPTPDMSTTPAPSQYAELFLSPMLNAPPDPAFALDGNELAIVAADPAHATITGHEPTILAAL